MAKESASRSHHIANIAHLFFADASETETDHDCCDDRGTAYLVASLAAGEICKNVCRQLNAKTAAKTAGKANPWRNWTSIAHDNGETRPRPRLVLCLMESEVADRESALKIGILLGKIDPHHLQVLVFSNVHSESEATAWPFGRKKAAGSSQAALLTWCGQLTRSLAGRCPVTVTVMPQDDQSALAKTEIPVINNIVRRLADEF